jgi:hypothetical protein
MPPSSPGPSRTARVRSEQSPSLYHHVDGLKGLRRETALYAAAELRHSLAKAAQEQQGTEALFAVARAYRDFAKQHPGLLGATRPAPQPGKDDELSDALASVAKALVDILTELGVTDEAVIHAIRTLRTFLHGVVDLEFRDGFGMPYHLEQTFESGLQILSEELLDKATSK